jgi:hypothetical protein
VLDPLGLGVKLVFVDLVLQLLTMAFETSECDFEESDLFFIYVSCLSQYQDVFKHCFLVWQISSVD